MTGATTVALLAAVVSAPLTPAAVRRIGRTNGEQIQECYDTWTASLADSPAQTTLLVDIRVRGSGRPEDIRPAKFGGTPFGDCVVSRIRRWKFPRHTGRTAAKASLTFDLIPAREVIAPYAPKRARTRLSPEAIKWVVAAQQGDVQTCFEGWLEGLDNSPGVVKMKLTLIILADGRTADVEPDVLKDTPLATCVTNRVLAWRFPSHDGPKPVTAVIPLRLVPRRAKAQAGKPDAATTSSLKASSPRRPRRLRPPGGLPPLGPEAPQEQPP